MESKKIMYDEKMNEMTNQENEMRSQDNIYSLNVSIHEKISDMLDEEYEKLSASYYDGYDKHDNDLIDDSFERMEVVDEVRKIVEKCNTHIELYAHLSAKIDYLYKGAEDFDKYYCAGGKNAYRTKYSEVEKLMNQIKLLVESEVI